MSKTVSINFHGQDLTVVTRDRVPYVAMKPICEHLGLDWEAQRQRIERDDLLNSVACKIQATAADGKVYDVTAIPVKFLNGWLFGIKINMVKEDVREMLRPKLIEYQLECYEVLDKHFRPKLDPILANEEFYRALKVLTDAGCSRQEALDDAIAHTLWDFSNNIAISGDEGDFLTVREICESVFPYRPTITPLAKQWVADKLVALGYVAKIKHRFRVTDRGEWHCRNQNAHISEVRWDKGVQEYLSVELLAHY